jgi:hypothetical protein
MPSCHFFWERAPVRGPELRKSLVFVDALTPTLFQKERG